MRKSPSLVLIIDTREQLPLDEFKAGIFSEIRKEGMPFADYWAMIEEKELPICFERKSLSDLFGTMTHGYKRFKRSLEKSKEFGVKMILLIEGSMKDVHKGIKHSQFEGESMLKKLAMLYVRYDLEYHFFNSRREMARFIEDIFSAIKRNYKV